MLEFKDKIDLFRKDSVTGEKTQIYSKIEADVQINKQSLLGGKNSNNSEMADAFVFIKKDKTNIQIGDTIKQKNRFGEDVIYKVTSRDFIDFENTEPFIELLCKLL